ncbi:hypothetical protein RV15_GL000913 [Enterococcus silesiacus]|uniref:Uncharacterized protein n=1 Tax=Enterococcus silesiacus TaxID=332949 RepID=A0AA91GHV9_9ENTE|nr:hypothetical protein [Enterococcus silesiacus]OJG91283.1 hypothetical protein RV15_GL000913 [Enterococcus silesiacus]
MFQELINFAAENKVLLKIKMIAVGHVPVAYERESNNVVKYRFVIEIETL